MTVSLIAKGQAMHMAAAHPADTSMCCTPAQMVAPRRLKNADCKLSQDLRCFKSSNRLLLTGD